MTRKLVQLGQSLAITLPVEVVQAFKLEKGQSIDVSVHPLTGAVTIRPPARYIAEGEVNDDFRALAEAVRKRYDAAFRELAR
jgi:antitoxin component of MazEF toxin-antitoxin module